MTEPHKHYFHFDNSLGNNPIRTQYFTLWQVGDLFLAPHEFVPEHKQECFEITFVERGYGKVHLNDTVYPVQKNDLQFSFENELHDLHAAPDSPFRFFYIALSPTPNTICETVVTALKEHCVENGCIFSFPNIFESVKSLLSEFYNKSVFYREQIEALVTDILISLYRKIISVSAERKIESPVRKDELIYNIINYINSQQNTLVTLKEISENFFYDYDYISRSFKEVMQISLRLFVRFAP